LFIEASLKKKVLSVTITGGPEPVIQILHPLLRAAWFTICTPCDFFVKTGNRPAREIAGLLKNADA